MKKPDWKLAQDKVAKALKDFAAPRKDIWPNRFTDTHEAGNIVQDQPSDQWVLYQGLFYLIEVKSSHYPNAFYLKDVRPSQLRGAIRSAAAGGRTIFMIAKLPEWQWYKADGQQLVAARDAGQPSIKWEEFELVPKLTAEAILL